MTTAEKADEIRKEIVTDGAYTLEEAVAILRSLDAATATVLRIIADFAMEDN